MAQPEGYHTILVQDHGPVYQFFPSREELVSYLTDLPSWLGHLFVLHGRCLHVTHGAFKFLVGDGEPPVPLFAPPVPGPLVVDGDLEAQVIPPDPDYTAATSSLKSV